MKRSHLLMGTVTLLFMAFCIIGGSLPMMADDSTFCTGNGSYQICTDKEDYAPEETVHITGSGFAAGTSLTIKVTRPDGSVVTGDGSFAPWPTAYDTVIVDTEGSFQFNYVLDGIEGKYLVEALDGDGTVLASHTFTDSRTVISVTLTYGGTTVPPGQITVYPGATISANVTVTTVTDSSNNDWESTSWRIATTPPGSTTCVNTPNHTSSGTYSETFNITAPTAPGTYNAYFRAYDGDTCSAANPSALFTLSDAIIVAADTNCSNVKIQLALLLDGSTSISDTNFNLMKTGLADAIQNAAPGCFVHDGSVELTVVQIGLVGSVGTALEVGPVVITASNATNVATSVRNITKRTGYTPLACAFYLAADTLYNSPCHQPGH